MLYYVLLGGTYEYEYEFVQHSPDGSANRSRQGIAQYFTPKSLILSESPMKKSNLKFNLVQI